jgi:signal transduction histidine kinase
MNPSPAGNPIDFKLIFESVPANYLILLPDPPKYTIVAVSDAYAHSTLNVRENMLNRGLFEVFPDNPDDPQASGVTNLSASLQQVVTSKRPHKMAVQKYDIPSSNGHGFEERYWSPLNTPVIDGQGEIRYIIHNVEDITEKVKTADQLEAQTETLRRTNEELEQFVRISSHDLKEPLRKMRTFAGLLQSRYNANLPEEGRLFLNKITGTAEKMNNRLGDLLQYTYLSAHHPFEPVNLQEVLEEALSDLELLITEKQAKINADPLPVIDGIRPQLHMLLYNLVYNSLKFTRSGESPVINIRATEYAAADDGENNQKKLEITVQDNGIGFEKEQAEKIFILFKQLKPKSAFLGSGIGLALCKKVVLNHGGEIFANGYPGKGAEFHVILPYSR